MNLRILIRILSGVLALIATSSLFAAHIIGGDVTYECLGGDRYEITMKLYRDCAGGGAIFDGSPSSFTNATVTIFKGNQIYITTLDPGSPVVNFVDVGETNPCVIPPPGLCVEEGIYVFEVDLPASDQSYHITYQRCCRNNTISNLVLPGDTGATFTVEIKPEAQSSCNSSPVFNNFPPVVICTNLPIEFDFGATDKDGDQLVYSLCSPIDGGGPNQGSPFAPDGVAPNPDSAPPYAPVSFQLPDYSFSNPIGGNPQLSIDVNTGFIDGIPLFEGQFVVGICVTEFRDGQELSKIRRDFQFNVETCQPTVVASIEADEILDDLTHVINICGEEFVTFNNLSYDQSFIQNFKWLFDLNEDTTLTNSQNWEPTFPLPDTGSYPGQLILNPGLFCDDTLNYIINVYPDIRSNFSFTYDTCDYSPVIFQDLGVSDEGEDAVIGWEWNFANQGTSLDPNPSFLFSEPGNLNIGLTITDINGCSDTKFNTIPYFPVPDLIVLSPDRSTACVPYEVYFENLSVPVDSTYDINWDFGDGGVGQGVSPSHLYEEVGLYTVSLDLTSPIGCKTDTTFENLIDILPTPEADFTYTPEVLDNFNPEIQFVDNSLDAAAWYWIFGNSGFSNEPDPSYTFPDTGLVEVYQIVTHQSGCRDTQSLILDIIPKATFYLPNAFTPNNDGLNDLFIGKGFTRGLTDFRLEVWNRYGELVFLYVM